MGLGSNQTHSYLGQASWLGVVKVVHAVPDRFEDTEKISDPAFIDGHWLDLRCERCDTDASADQEHSLKLEEIL